LRGTRTAAGNDESGAVKTWRREVAGTDEFASATSFNVGSGGPTIGIHEPIHQPRRLDINPASANDSRETSIN